MLVITYFFRALLSRTHVSHLSIHGKKCIHLGFFVYCALRLHRIVLSLQKIINQLIFRTWLIYAIVNSMLF